MRRIFITAMLTILVAMPARASIFGEENAALYQILMNAIQQLAQLRAILSSDQDTLGLLERVNEGIDNSVNLLQTISPNTDPGIYGDWGKVGEGLRKLQAIYGIIVPSPDFQVEKDTDENVAEAVSFNNSIYKYSDQIDAIDQEIRNYSKDASPGRAQQLTSHTLGIMLHVVNQSLRAQATSLKIQAQSLAIQNHKDKEKTRLISSTSTDLETSLKNEDPKFEFPRF